MLLIGSSHKGRDQWEEEAPYQLSRLPLHLKISERRTVEVDCRGGLITRNKRRAPQDGMMASGVCIVDRLAGRRGNHSK